MQDSYLEANATPRAAFAGCSDVRGTWDDLEALVKHDETSAQAASQYAAAYAAHYQMNDLSEALSLYRAIMTTHPRSQEAKYSYAQIQSIVRAVVPEQTIFEALIDLVVARLKE